MKKIITVLCIAVMALSLFAGCGQKADDNNTADAGGSSITVADTGIGIAPEELPRVKDRFYKGKSSRRGSGIGLAVADEIINMHGGSLKLTSRKGEGTTVTITLPLARG